MRQLTGSFLCGLDNGQLNELAEYICPEQSQCSRCGRGNCTGRRIIFATLVWIARQDLVPFLLEPRPQVCDSDLPFRDTKTKETQTTWPREFLEQMTLIDRQLFDQVQLQLRSPFLELIWPQDTTELTVEDAVTLPWTSFRAVRMSSPGTPSEVGEVQIHPDHHALVSLSALSLYLLHCNQGDMKGHMMFYCLADHRVGVQQGHVNLFALKVFENNRIGTAAFKSEFRAYQKMHKHDKITPLLAAFRHKQRFCLVFPWAHGGNLEEFWASHTMDEQYSVEWVMRESLELADGLATLHGFTGSGNIGNSTFASSAALLHADIKPTNILCFQIEGKQTLSLKLADFGLSREVNPDSKLDSNSLLQTKTYRAPEQDVEQEVSLKSDVWSLGCLFLEFITWCLVGSQGVAMFSKQREREYDDPEATNAIGETYGNLFFMKVVEKQLWFGRSGLRLDMAVNAPPLEEARSAKHLAGRIYSLRVKKSVQVGCRVKFAVTTVSKYISCLIPTYLMIRYTDQHCEAHQRSKQSQAMHPKAAEIPIFRPE